MLTIVRWDEMVGGEWWIWAVLTDAVCCLCRKQAFMASESE